MSTTWGSDQPPPERPQMPPVTLPWPSDDDTGIDASDFVEAIILLEYTP